MRQGRLHSRHHAVQFYGDDPSLFRTVAGFLSAGLINAEPAIVIATEPHRAGILEQLAARMIDVDQARRMGDLVLLDAEGLLSLFMVGEEPDSSLFDHNLTGLIEQTLAGRTRTLVRAYGEMVDILWKDGLSEAAIKVEMLWNRLAARHSFALLCGYSMGSFYKQPNDLADICAQHTHVSGLGNKVVRFEKRRVRRA
jgi:hypothetical protein